LSDPRLVPDLEGFLRGDQPPIFSVTQNAVFKQLLALASPQDVRPFVVGEAAKQMRIKGKNGAAPERFELPTLLVRTQGLRGWRLLRGLVSVRKI
jgi:hypothetical protein